MISGVDPDATKTTEEETKTAVVEEPEEPAEILNLPENTPYLSDPPKDSYYELKIGESLALELG